MTRTAHVEPLGEAAFLCRIRGSDAFALAQALAETIAAARPAGVVDAAAAYDTVAVYHEPALRSSHDLRDAVLDMLHALPAPQSREGPHVTIPVVYDGPDLDLVAERTGLSRDSVVELHSGIEYRAQAVGFVPGFAYLGDLDWRLRMPRRSAPRPRVPAGSVAIAGQHTAVYPFVTPGGWHLIGTTTHTMFDAARSPPALITVGTRVRFDPA